MPVAPAGFIDIEMIGNQVQVDRMVAYLEQRMSPSSIFAFLEIRIEPYLKERIANRFKSEGDDVSGGWAPLAEPTKAIRAWGASQGVWDVAEDHPINQRTHAMYEFLTQDTWQVMSGGAAVSLSSPKTVSREMREKLRAAAGRKPNTPARPVLGLNETDLGYVITQLAFHIQLGSTSP
jgi:hypothetical protein